MTKVEFFLSQNKQYTAIDLMGHAGYAEEGEDIVCAAISSTVQLTHALLSDVRKLHVDALIEQDGAHIRLTLDPRDRMAGQDAFKALHLFYTELEQTHSDHIKVTEVYDHATD